MNPKADCMSSVKSQTVLVTRQRILVYVCFTTRIHIEDDYALDYYTERAVLG